MAKKRIPRRRLVEFLAVTSTTLTVFTDIQKELESLTDDQGLIDGVFEATAGLARCRDCLADAVLKSKKT